MKNHYDFSNSFKRPEFTERLRKNGHVTREDCDGFSVYTRYSPSGTIAERYILRADTNERLDLSPAVGVR